MKIFYISKSFPKEEAYSLTDQIRRSSRSVCSNLAEAFRKRRYQNAFVHTLSMSEAEAAETLVWLEYAFKCNYISDPTYRKLIDHYDHIIGMLVNMIRKPEKWMISSK
jgi:four helix bundle protein